MGARSRETTHQGEVVASTMNERDELLDEIELLLGQERWAEALGLLERLPEDDPLRYLQAVDVWLGMGIAARAEATLDRGRELAGDDDPLVALLAARLHLTRWDGASARAAIERVAPKQRDADLEAELALIADLEGRHDDAHAHLKRAHKLDKQVFPKPVRVSVDEFEAMLADAADALAPQFREALAEITVVIDPMPTADVVGGEESGHPPDLLGLYSGLELHEREASGYGELPPTIFLFQRNLERKVASVEELREEVRITLYHELGHALGFDEDGVEEMGLG